LEIFGSKHKRWEMNSRIKSCKFRSPRPDTNPSRILDDLDQRVEGTYDKLKRGTKRLQHFILANEGGNASSIVF
jgi:hypothetical protein